uniref:Actin epsilon 1 n=1 Tax=Equus caballus TaxID=9796 RepID=F6TYC5_HORSE|nr:actin-like isoform X3 [Equus caballus]
MNVPLICDYGSGFSKVGFSGTEVPQAVFPTILGKLRHDNLLVGMEEKDWFIGDEVQKKWGQLNLQQPISRATITNWDNVEKIWHHSFYQVLRIAPEQHPLMVTEPPLNSMSVKDRMSQILFESFNVPALYLANQGVLSLYSSGQTSGTTIESGEGMTYIVPISDSCPLNQSTIQMDVAGQDLTLYLLQQLSDSGHSLVSTGRNRPGIHLTAFQSISSCRRGLWKVLFGHIILSGGTSSCLGLRDRMQRELCSLVTPAINVKVSASPYSSYSAWVGGSILCSLSTFKDMWVTNDEYKEMGSSVVSRRNF